MTDVATDAKPANLTAVPNSEEDDEDGKKGKTAKSRRELPAGAVATLKAWLLSPEHFTHPYPTPQDQVILMQKTGIDKKQLKNWFTNARRRIWKPMLKKQLEQGKMAQTGTGGVVALPGSGPAGLVSAPGVPGTEFAPATGPPGQAIAVDHSQVMQQSYQQAMHQQPQSSQQQQPQQQQPTTYETYSNTYVQQQPAQQQQNNQPQQNQSPNTQTLHPGMPMGNQIHYFSQNQYTQPQQQNTTGVNDPVSQAGGTVSNIPNNAVAGAPGLPTTTPANTTSSPVNISNMNKTDSHAVLMELFARDQDLVRQATEGAKQNSVVNNGTNNPNTSGSGSIEQSNTNNNNNNQQQQTSGIHPSQIGSNINGGGSQHPMSKVATTGSSTLNKLGNVPSLNSWPHFSSSTSLMKLGNMTGVKSITNMSGADLVSQGSLNMKGNLAQVKSIESMGRADSFAFLEVFFDNPPSGSSQERRGVKREREEDDNVGLSLDGDESSSPPASAPSHPGAATSINASSAPLNVPSIQPQPEEKDKDGLKRAYDDALAARGLISVSRSCEKLTDLAIPEKMQRSISQEYLKSMNTGNGGSTTFTSFSFQSGNKHSTNTQGPPAKVQKTVLPTTSSSPSTYNVQSQQYPGQTPQQFQMKNDTSAPAPLSDPSSSGASVEVPATAKCAICGCINVDTQLRPCGHMFHGRCLKPSLQSAQGAPLCPIDHIPMQSAVLAVPTDECTPVPTTSTNYQSNNNTAQSNTTKSEV